MAARAASAHPINRVGAAPRLDKVVEDILQHFDARLEAMDGGKGMIVCMSRRICVEVYTVEAEEVKDEVGFFTAVQAAIRKMDAGSRSGRSVDEADLAISQLLNRAVTSTEVVDILKAAGMDRPDIGVLSEEFLLGLKNTPQKSLAVEALKKLLNGCKCWIKIPQKCWIKIPHFTGLGVTPCCVTAPPILVAARAV